MIGFEDQPDSIQQTLAACFVGHIFVVIGLEDVNAFDVCALVEIGFDLFVSSLINPVFDNLLILGVYFCIDRGGVEHCESGKFLESPVVLHGGIIFSL